MMWPFKGKRRVLVAWLPAKRLPTFGGSVPNPLAEVNSWHMRTVVTFGGVDYVKDRWKENLVALDDLEWRPAE